jgi:hypothetical protein
MYWLSLVLPDKMKRQFLDYSVTSNRFDSDELGNEKQRINPLFSVISTLQIAQRLTIACLKRRTKHRTNQPPLETLLPAIQSLEAL